MQKANANAPKILDALTLLGRADTSHVAFAMLGLPADLQKNAQAAVTALRPVADRLISRKIACELRIEMARIRRASAHAADTNSQDWGSPPSECLPEVIGSANAEDRWSLAATFSHVSSGWHDAITQWRSEQRTILLANATDAGVRMVARVSPCVERLRLISLHGRLLLRGGTLALLTRSCPRLQWLGLQDAVLPTSDALQWLPETLPGLRWLDLSGLRCAQMQQEAELCSVLGDEESGEDPPAHWYWENIEALCTRLPELQSLIIYRCDQTGALKNPRVRQALGTRLHIQSCGCKDCTVFALARGTQRNHRFGPGYAEVDYSTVRAIPDDLLTEIERLESGARFADLAELEREKRYGPQ